MVPSHPTAAFENPNHATKPESEMPDLLNLALFLAAATLLAITPGPGILFVAARTLADGRSAGFASTFGTGVGGLVQVAAGAAGLSALMLASAEAFAIVKLLGAAYLVWLGIRMIREAGQGFDPDVTPSSSRHAFRDGIVVELFNPKTAAFLLAFIPQFVDPARGPVWLQFAVLGVITVALNTGVDLLVALGADRLRSGVGKRQALVTRIRQGSGLAMCGLGAALAFARRPAG